MSLPKSITIYEVGPREGIQIEDNEILTDEKIKLVNMLGKTGLKNIEVTSFVSPKWVPQMADADEVLARIRREPNVDYRSVFLNIKGLERAINNNVTIEGSLFLTASNAFSKRNTNKNIDETLEALPDWIQAYKKENIPVNKVFIMTAFGCNFEGDIPSDRIIKLIESSMAQAGKYGEKIKKVKLADTMGWANPEQIKKTIFTLKNRWPDIQIGLHLHDTRGLGLTNVYAALKESVDDFDSAVGGLGGCPFAATKGAAGNIATEDLVFMCEEMGIETGVDLNLLLESVKYSEKIFKRDLPGHLLSGGLVSNIRKNQAFN